MVTAMARRTAAWLAEPMPRYILIPIILMIALIAFGGLQRFQDLTDANIREAAIEAAARDYQQCLIRVETRDSLREVLIGITELFPDSSGAQAIRDLIENEYPPLDPVSCGVNPATG